MYRHHPQTALLRQLTREAIGELRLIRAAFSFDVLAHRTAEDVRLQADLDGGSLMDVGCYCVNASRLLAGEPERVSAEQVVGPSGVDVRFAATMRFPEGAISQFDAGLELPTRDELEVIGSQGSLFLGDPWHCQSPVIEVRRNGEVEQLQVEVADPYRLELENVSDAILGRSELDPGRADAVGQARAIAALYRAAETGTVVSVG